MDEPLVEVGESKEHLDVLICLGLWLFLNGLYPDWIYDDALGRHYEP
jgi:hypothetical protein